MDYICVKLKHIVRWEIPQSNSICAEEKKFKWKLNKPEPAASPARSTTSAAAAENSSIECRERFFSNRHLLLRFFGELLQLLTTKVWDPLRFWWWSFLKTFLVETTTKVYTPSAHNSLEWWIEERMVSNLGWLFDWMGRKGAFWEDSWATLRVPISLLCFYLCL